MLSYAEYTIRGMTPHVQHNGQLADPTNIWAQKMKDITKKRTKTEEDYQLLQDYEWEGSLYLNANNRVVVPGSSIIGALTMAGKKSREGAVIRSAVTSPGDWPLDFDGPKDLAKLRADPNFRFRVGVKIKQSRIMRTRPIFRTWGLTFKVGFRPDIIGPKDLDSIVSVLGFDVGLSDDNKLMGGRFEVVRRKDCNAA